MGSRARAPAPHFGGFLNISEFARSRPYMYHLTDRGNAERISKTNGISPASSLMVSAGRHDLVRRRRRQHERIMVGGNVILIRDQAPLHEGNLDLPNGYSYEDLIDSINSRIFFWPGTAAGPISYGVRHFGRYRDERPVILRVGIESLLRANPAVEPKFCRYNSGSPRCSNGRKSPRGPDTFVAAARFEGTPSSVVEVTFEGALVLPADTTVGEDPKGPWVLLSLYKP
jgi:hypothetical protein